MLPYDMLFIALIDIDVLGCWWKKHYNRRDDEFFATTSKNYHSTFSEVATHSCFCDDLYVSPSWCKGNIFEISYIREEYES